MSFDSLHHQDEPLLICNVWDVPSAKTAEKLNFKAIATSSAAMARLLGYKDGEGMSFSDLLFLVERIASNTKLPLSVDLESGYSHDPEQIVNHITKLAESGVTGINLEDSTVAEGRKLTDAHEFSDKLRAIKNGLDKNDIDIFINVRTDPFLLGLADAVEETKKRIHLYETSGADGIFTPCIERTADIEQIVDCTRLPVNVMCMPALPDFNTLKELGVKRISMGNFLFDKMYTQFGQMLSGIIEEQSFKPIF